MAMAILSSSIPIIVSLSSQSRSLIYDINILQSQLIHAHIFIQERLLNHIVNYDKLSIDIDTKLYRSIEHNHEKYIFSFHHNKRLTVNISSPALNLP